MIDRIAPTRRPVRKAAGYQQWRSLLFMHWPIPAEVLRPLVPNSLELDLFHNIAYVGIVPFAMQGVRPRWSPSLLGFRFLETNVRTYVTHRERPGVYFFSLDAASRIAVSIARRFWGLPYCFADMLFERQAELVSYRSVRRVSGVRHEVRCRLGPSLEPSLPDTIEFFFLERYLLFLERGLKLYCGQVHHRPYPVQQAEIVELHDELMPAAGLDPGGALPDYSHFSTGVDVEVFRLQPCS